MIDSDSKALRATDANTVVEGDRVRLKFLYPNGSMEMMECTWLSTSTLGAPENPNGSWVLVSVDDHVFWKPLSHLIQLEVLEANGDARNGRRSLGAEFDHYHR